jgi:hypothetical protein
MLAMRVQAKIKKLLAKEKSVKREGWFDAVIQVEVLF